MKRNRRGGVEDRWTKTVRDTHGTKRTVPSARDGVGLRWLARYVDQEGREHTKSFARKTDAQWWLDEVTAAVVTGQYVDPKAGQITFRDYAERWRKMQVQRPGSRVHVETMLRRHAYPTLGDRHLTSILPSDIQAWITSLELAPATVGVLHGIVSTVMRRRSGIGGLGLILATERNCRRCTARRSCPWQPNMWRRSALPYRHRYRRSSRWRRAPGCVRANASV
jgi:hypothetical protein